MELINYRLNGRTTSYVNTKEEIERCDYLAKVKKVSDKNGSGTAELAFVSKNDTTLFYKLNGWTLNPAAQIDYDWGSSTLKMFITDPRGIGKLIELNIDKG